MIDTPLPAGFRNSLAVPEPDALCGALLTEPEVSVSLNRSKTDAVLPDPVPWARAGFYLESRPTFTFDPALHQGLYYVQDASSMATARAVEEAVRLSGAGCAPLRFLDACAAPGGKTLGAMDALPHGSFIVANEFSPRRLPVLAENVAKWGTAPVIITNTDAAGITGPDGFFDIVAADVPCSGEGMMRKEAEARRQWSEALVRDCAALQSSIVDALARALRPGGFLVYSTCTFNLDENERIVARLIERHGMHPVPVPALDGQEGVLGALEGDFPAYRFLPGRIRGEGLFLCLLRKPGDTPAAEPRRAKSAAKRPDAAVTRLLTGDYDWLTDRDGTVHALPANGAPLLAALSKSLRVSVPGLPVAQPKGRDLVPTQQLALSTAMSADAFPRVEIDAPTALSYLGHNAITLPDGPPRGIVLLTHRGAPLGFAKNLGTRANNLYPAPWRILTPNPSPTSIL